MASHSRHVLSLPGEVRTQVKFRRDDLLLVHDRPLRDPLAAERQRRAKAQGFDPRLLVVEVPGLPIRTRNGNLVGPTLLDMLVRGPACCMEVACGSAGWADVRSLTLT